MAENETTTDIRQAPRRRTLWDWSQLLLSPALLVTGVLWLTFQQNQLSIQTSRQQRDTELQIADEQRQESLLSTYQAHIDDLLVHENLLHEKQTTSTIKLVAQVETLTTLRELKPAGKAMLLRYLFDTKLINNDYHIIDLSDADLRGATLQGLDLRDTNLFGADLQGADLRHCDLTYATLDYTNLSGANLAGADLHGGSLRSTDVTGADLEGANLKDVTGTTESQLAKAKSLVSTILPDGSTHP